MSQTQQLAKSQTQNPKKLVWTPSPTAGLLSYLVPGLGQIYDGRTGKGLMFMACLLGMFFTGQALGGWRNVYLPRIDPTKDENAFAKQFPHPISDVLVRWHFGGQFWIGVAAWPAIWQYGGGPVPSTEESPFWHNFQRAPDERELNEQLIASDKMPDLAWVYTVIAGILNILVIYDAYAGPAHKEEEPAAA